MISVYDMRRLMPEQPSYRGVILENLTSIEQEEARDILNEMIAEAKHEARLGMEGVVFKKWDLHEFTKVNCFIKNELEKYGFQWWFTDENWFNLSWK